MRLLLVAMMCLVGLSASTSQRNKPRSSLRHDAYIWQRLWTRDVIAAVRQSSDLVRAWRILLAEADRAGRWTKVAIPWGELNASERPLVGVLRIDGRLDDARMPAVLDEVAAIVATASPLTGVEIDYDCPTSKLATYARFLRALRARLPASLKLSITALPTWMNSPHLERLVTSLDEVVLQVHAVEGPHRGLFNPAQAGRWVREFAFRTGIPFRVALPAYDVRVAWTRDGALSSVEGEIPLLAGAAPAATLRAAPEVLLAFLRGLRQSAPDNLAGIAWFRLPTSADRRGWSGETWRAVLTDQMPVARLSASLVSADETELWTVTLSNDGATDAKVPRRVPLDPGCAVADGANGFRLVDGVPLALESKGDGRLRPHDSRVIGWARCTAPRRHLEISP